MKVADLYKVYKGSAQVTAIAFDKETKEYISIRSIGKFSSLNQISEYFDYEVRSIIPDCGFMLWVDIVEWI